jgi:integrase
MAAMVGNTPEQHPEGKYYLSLGGKWLPAGTSATDAVQRLSLLNAQLEYEAKGGKVAGQVPAQALGVGDTPVAKPKAVTVEEAQKAYLAHMALQVRAGKLKQRTLVNATSITDEFLVWLGKNTKHTTTTQITAADVDGYVAWAIEQSPTKSTRTGANKYIRVGQFLKHAGLKVTSNKEAPRYSKDTPVRIYSPEELETFFSACTPEQALIYRTFLKTGLREMELVTLERGDIDATKGCLTIRAKSQWGFTPKTWDSRQVWLDDEILADLADHLMTHKHKLVFPTSGGLPNYKLLRGLKRICKRAGLPEAEWWLHAFRSSYATGLLRDGLGIPEVQRLLGHSLGSQSIWRYVRAIEGEELRDKLNTINRRKEAGPNVVKMKKRA